MRVRKGERISTNQFAHDGERKDRCGEGDRKRKESNSGWTAADLSWLAIRRTSRP